MFQVPNGKLIVGAFSIVVGIVEIAVAAVMFLTGKPKGNQFYRYDLVWFTSGLIQTSIGFMMAFG